MVLKSFSGRTVAAYLQAVVSYKEGDGCGPGQAVVIGEFDRHPVPGSGGFGCAKPLEGGNRRVCFPTDEGGYACGVLEYCWWVELLAVGTGDHHQGIVPGASRLGHHRQACQHQHTPCGPGAESCRSHRER